MKTLKAYEVREDGEGYCCVVFSTNGAAARREGAGELGTDWECIESCRRAPHLDQYAPGPVPAMTLIEHGWWFECQYCGRRVSNEMAEELEDDGLNPADFNPRPAGKDSVFCSESCECADHMTRRGREEAADALREVFEAKFPGATIVDIHCYDGPLLKAQNLRHGKTHVVTFTFPGSQYRSKWHFGDEFACVPQIDIDAFKAWLQCREKELLVIDAAIASVKGGAS